MPLSSMAMFELLTEEKKRTRRAKEEREGLGGLDEEKLDDLHSEVQATGSGAPSVEGLQTPAPTRVRAVHNQPIEETRITMSKKTRFEPVPKEDRLARERAERSPAAGRQPVDGAAAVVAGEPLRDDHGGGEGGGPREPSARAVHSRQQHQGAVTGHQDVSARFQQPSWSRPSSAAYD